MSNTIMFVVKCLTNSFCNPSLNISNGPGRSKSVLFISQEVVPNKLMDINLIDYSFELPGNNTEETDGSILRRG